jgi:hypothetical protein
MPDFSDCAFASEEPDADWLAVAHEGGPARGLSPLMPPHGASLGKDVLQLVIAHIRTFCRDTRWPPGALNLPRPQLTEKAFPEDEAVAAVAFNANRETSASLELAYEKRLGARGQLELALPFALEEVAGGSRQAGLGDVAVAGKLALWHSQRSIVSVQGEVALPTGDRDRGLGDGTVVLEPSLLWARILPRDFFLHGQLLGSFPTRGDRGNDELRLNLALGRSFAANRGFGRLWAPMLEVTTTRVFAGGGASDWECDLAPQLHLTLSRRQHVRASLGVQVPVTQTQQRPVRVLLYVLWDWRDGGLTEGW